MDMSNVSKVKRIVTDDLKGLLPVTIKFSAPIEVITDYMVRLAASNTSGQYLSSNDVESCVRSIFDNEVDLSEAIRAIVLFDSSLTPQYVATRYSKGMEAMAAGASAGENTYHYAVWKSWRGFSSVIRRRVTHNPLSFTWERYRSKRVSWIDGYDFPLHSRKATLISAGMGSALAIPTILSPNFFKGWAYVVYVYAFGLCIPALYNLRLTPHYLVKYIQPTVEYMKNDSVIFQKPAQMPSCMREQANACVYWNRSCDSEERGCCNIIKGIQSLVCITVYFFIGVIIMRVWSTEENAPSIIGFFGALFAYFMVLIPFGLGLSLLKSFDFRPVNPKNPRSATYVGPEDYHRLNGSHAEEVCIGLRVPKCSDLWSSIYHLDHDSITYLDHYLPALCFSRSLEGVTFFDKEGGHYEICSSFNSVLLKMFFSDYQHFDQGLQQTASRGAFDSKRTVSLVAKEKIGGLDVGTMGLGYRVVRAYFLKEGGKVKSSGEFVDAPLHLTITSTLYAFRLLARQARFLMGRINGEGEGAFGGQEGCLDDDVLLDDSFHALELVSHLYEDYVAQRLFNTLVQLKRGEMPKTQNTTMTIMNEDDEDDANDGDDEMLLTMIMDPVDYHYLMSHIIEQYDLGKLRDKFSGHGNIALHQSLSQCVYTKPVNLEKVEKDACSYVIHDEVHDDKLEADDVSFLTFSANIFGLFVSESTEELAFHAKNLALCVEELEEDHHRVAQDGVEGDSMLAAFLGSAAKTRPLSIAPLLFQVKNTLCKYLHPGNLFAKHYAIMFSDENHLIKNAQRLEEAQVREGFEGYDSYDSAKSYIRKIVTPLEKEKLAYHNDYASWIKQLDEPKIAKEYYSKVVSRALANQPRIEKNSVLISKEACYDGALESAQENEQETLAATDPMSTNSTWV